MANDLSTVDDFVSGNESDTTKTSEQQVPGKYFLISVPHFTGDTKKGEPDKQGNLTVDSSKTSFLRIGAPNKPWMTEQGSNLARLAYLVGPAGYGAPNPDANGNVAPIRDPEVLARFTKEKLADGTTKNPEYDKAFADYLMGEDEPAVFSPFIDDYRRRGSGNENPAGPEGHGFTSAQRKAKSARLEADSGWRDHADGNRITTTAGDKIEVIQGNYKLIVLGRTKELGQGMGWEASGNNVQDYAGATMPGASVTVTWIKEAYIDPTDIDALNRRVTELQQAQQTLELLISAIDGKLPTASHEPTNQGGWTNTGPSEYDKLLAERGRLQAEVDTLKNTTIPAAQQAVVDGIAFNADYKGGAWLLQNSTERVYQYSRNAGNFKEENWGDLWETYVGSENPVRVGRKDDDGMQGHPANHYKYGEPETKLTEPVPKNSSYGLPRGNPHIIEKTWATKIESYTGSSAWKIPSIHEETWADAITESTHCTGTISSETHANAITEVTVANAIASTTDAAVIVEHTAAAAHVEVHTGALHSSIEVGGVIDLFLGGKIDIDISGTYEVKLGPHEEFKTKKEKAALQDKQVALDSFVAQLSGKRMSNVELMAALKTTITALKVDLGV
ncbi:Putative cell-wall-anchored protein SasA (LPXTG motif) [Minicystis rosea]|nr:Putative cell-wall-anchored protein SasA (LPXTG motif) [Minicystis rosea]